MDTNLDIKKSLIVIAIIFFGTIGLSVLVLVIWDKVAKVEKVEAPKSTMEPYTMYMEWNKEIFENYGLEGVNAPSGVFYQYCEKGKTYAYGEFYTDDIQKFYYFFSNVYEQIWGRIINVENLFNVEENIYTFEEKCIMPTENGLIEEGEEDELEHMILSFKYNRNNNKVTVRCQEVNEHNVEEKNSKAKK